MVVILLVRADQTALNEKRGGAVGAMRQPARSDRSVRADPGLGQDGWALADNDFQFRCRMAQGLTVTLSPDADRRAPRGDGAASGPPTSGGQSAYDPGGPAGPFRTPGVSNPSPPVVF